MPYIFWTGPPIPYPTPTTTLTLTPVTHHQRCVALCPSHSLLHCSNKLSDALISKFITAFGDHGDIRGAIHWFHRAPKPKVLRGDVVSSPITPYWACRWEQTVLQISGKVNSFFFFLNSKRHLSAWRRCWNRVVAPMLWPTTQLLRILFWTGSFLLGHKIKNCWDKKWKGNGRVKWGKGGASFGQQQKRDVSFRKKKKCFFEERKKRKC